MIYFDFHTHHISNDPEIVGLYNQIIAPDLAQELDLPEGQFRSCGIHPWYIEGEGISQWGRLEAVAQSPEVLAIGESGLDRLAKTDWKSQIRLFEAQAQLADELGKPLIIHCVRAWDSLLACRKRINPHVPWILHGFRGKAALAQQLIRQGFGFSIGFHYSIPSLRILPSDRLFLETDEGPADIRELYRRVANDLSIPIETLADRIKKNINSLFSLSY